jgi:hypothetical protein
MRQEYDFNESCEAFTNGCWTKIRPLQEGLFLTLTDRMEHSRPLYVFRIDGVFLDELQFGSRHFVGANPGWGGYWWSEAVPEPPMTLAEFMLD